MNDPIISRNLNWVVQRTRGDPEIFRRRASIETKRLWIGCSDNASATFETGAFEEDGCLVYRNLGNQVSPHDFGLLATLEYALHSLKVDEIVVCGHYGCACLKNVLQTENTSLAGCWANPIRAIVDQHRRQLEEIVSEDAQIQTLSELNVRMQIRNLQENALTRPLLVTGRVRLQGVVWSPRDGLLRDLGVGVSRLKKSKKNRD
jgi:carbonic anhydrase